jgi:solute carrier family 10 (sodium/bile acid cotransporter), member 7
VASALCNAVLGNFLGIFITPALLLYFFGSHIELPFLGMLGKLSKKVLVPVALGQALRATKLKDFYKAHSKLFKRLQEIILLSILWNAFCTAISENLGLELQHALALTALLPAVHLLSLGALFALFLDPFFNSNEAKW